MSTLLNTVIELVRSWYGVDRIRIMPTTGRLLQLSVGDSILFQNELYAVGARTISGCGQVAYRLVHAAGEGTLTVPIHTAGGISEGCLSINGESHIMFDSDIVIRRPPAAVNALR